jgi:hypothetical protein
MLIKKLTEIASKIDEDNGPWIMKFSKEKIPIKIYKISTYINEP